MTASGHKSASQTRLPPSPAGEGENTAVPIAVCGEVITEETVKALEYYGVKTVLTVKDL